MREKKKQIFWVTFREENELAQYYDKLWTIFKCLYIGIWINQFCGLVILRNESFNQQYGYNSKSPEFNVGYTEWTSIVWNTTIHFIWLYYDIICLSLLVLVFREIKLGKRNNHIYPFSEVSYHTYGACILLNTLGTLVSHAIGTEYHLNLSACLLIFIMMTSIVCVGILVRTLKAENESLNHEDSSVDSKFMITMIIKQSIHCAWTIMATLLYVTISLNIEEQCRIRPLLMTNLGFMSAMSYEWSHYLCKQTSSPSSFCSDFAFVWNLNGAMKAILYGLMILSFE